VLLSTHDPSIMARADRVLEIHDGVLTERGVLAQPAASG